MGNRADGGRCGLVPKIAIVTIILVTATSNPANFANAEESIESISWSGNVESFDVETHSGTISGTLPCAPSGECSPYPASCWENVSLFLGLEGSKQPQDFGVNAHFGGRFAVNAGIPLHQPSGLGLQIGTSLNATANAVQVVERVIGDTGRTQSFTTIGLFQRLDNGLKWGFGYDFLYQEYYDDFNLGQWRGRVGYDLSPMNEIGFQASISDHNDSGYFGPFLVGLDPISQGSFYWRHTWPNLAQIGLWVGLTEGHGEPNVALGDLAPKDETFVFGSDVFVPLTNYLALFGEANFISPADTGTVDAYLGFEFFPWGGAYSRKRSPYAPIMPVANNTSFAVDLTSR